MEPKAKTWALSTKGWHNSFCACGDPPGHLKICLDSIGETSGGPGGGGAFAGDDPGDEQLVSLLEELERDIGESGPANTEPR